MKRAGNFQRLENNFGKARLVYYMRLPRPRSIGCYEAPCALRSELFHIPGLILNLDHKPLCELFQFGGTHLMLLVIEKSLKQRYVLLKIRKGFLILIEQQQWQFVWCSYFLIFDNSIRCLERSTPFRTWSSWPISTFSYISFGGNIYCIIFLLI